MKPRGAYYAYFFLEDEEEIDQVWEYVSGQREPVVDGRGATVERSWGRARFFVHRGLAHLIILYDIELGEVLQRVEGIRRELEDPLASSLGDAVVLIAPREDGNKAARMMGRPGPATSLNAGRLVHVLGAEGNAYVYVPAEKIDVNFLSGDLPRLDSSFQAFRSKAGFFRQRVQWVERERREVEEQVGQVLYGEDGAPEAFEEDIGELSRSYERLVSYGRLIREARGDIQTDISALDADLEELGARPDNGNGFHELYLAKSSQFLQQLSAAARQVEASQENARAAIEVVSTRVSLLQSSEAVSIAAGIKSLQEEGLTLQAAAGLIELVLVYYYSLSSWKLLAPEAFKHVPGSLKLFVILAFSLSAVAATHTGAHALREQKITRDVFVSLVVLALSLIGILVLTLTVS